MSQQLSFAEARLFVPDTGAIRQFYEGVLGMEVIAADATSVQFRCGRSLLVFEQRAGATPYHFAINIPSGQEETALQWLRERVAILPFGGEDIVDFSNWNAKAIYFYDPAGNIVELIARRNLQYPDTSPFSASAFLEISEIGIGTSDITAIYRPIHQATGMDIFDGSFDRFCAIGEETALFITVDYRQKKWFPVDDPVYPSSFQARLRKGSQSYDLRYEKEVIHIINN